MAYSEYEVIVDTNHNHLSNVELLGYMDQARYDWYMYCIALGVEALVVHLSTDFKKEVFKNDRISIYTTIERVGNTSFTLHQKVIKQDTKEMIAEGQVVLATVDHQTRVKTPVPQLVRDLLKNQGTLKDDHLKVNSKN